MSNDATIKTSETNTLSVTSEIVYEPGSVDSQQLKFKVSETNTLSVTSEIVSKPDSVDSQ